MITTILQPNATCPDSIGGERGEVGPDETMLAGGE